MPHEKLPPMMPAIRVEMPGAGFRLVLGEAPVPRPAGREILIQVAAAGLNRADLLQAQGLYPPPPGASDILGLEAAGTVVATGPQAERFRPGDRVAVLLAGGGYAGYCAVDEGAALPVPEAMSFAEAAAWPEALFTVWTNVAERGQLAPGESLLVHGGASGIGTVAIQLFAARRHRVFATAGTPEKVALCTRLGAHGIDYRGEDFVRVVKAATAGQGVDVILDMVGGRYIPRNIEALARDGRLVNIAYQEGAKVEVNFLPVMLKRLTLTGSTLRIRGAEEKAALARAVEREAWPLVTEGRIKAVIDRIVPLPEAHAALARLASGGHAGKIVLTMG